MRFTKAEVLAKVKVTYNRLADTGEFDKHLEKLPCSRDGFYYIQGKEDDNIYYMVKCGNCGHETKFEHFDSIKDTICPDCGHKLHYNFNYLDYGDRTMYIIYPEVLSPEELVLYQLEYNLEKNSEPDDSDYQACSYGWSHNDKYYAYYINKKQGVYVFDNCCFGYFNANLKEISRTYLCYGAVIRTFINPQIYREFIGNQDASVTNPRELWRDLEQYHDAIKREKATVAVKTDVKEDSIQLGLPKITAPHLKRAVNYIGSNVQKSSFHCPVHNITTHVTGSPAGLIKI